MLGPRALAGAWQAARPDSLINGVQIGTITYSFRSMPDQSAEATLRYCVESGISGIELMGGPVEAYARARTGFEPPSSGGRGGGRPRGGGGRRGPDPATLTASWNGVACAPAQPGSDPVIGDEPLNAGGAGGRGGSPTPEQLAAQQAQRDWRMGLSMDIFRDLRRMYNNAGVSIYAVKDVRAGSDEELEYTFAVAEALGATHVTLELPSGPTAAAELRRMGDWAERKKIYAAYHTHTQGSMTAFDEAFAISPGNMANVDLGHFVAGGNRGGTPLDFLAEYHGRIASVHLKDRTLPENCALNLPWGDGQTPIREILQAMHSNGWTFPASIELEYAIPEGSDAVQEVARCLDYCRAALA
ncbi:MAG: sugar phosphate isomerase/epimerase [Acidobacteriota bacterium]